MELFTNVSLGTNLFKGYSLSEALDMTKAWGFEYTELASIVNFCEHIKPEDITAEYAAEIKELLDQKGLKCHAVSGHVDPTEDKQFHDLMKKIEFAGRIGAKIVNTNSGPVKNIDIFHKNMVKLIEQAEKWNVIIGLESHGDIVDTAKGSIDIFKRYNHPLVRLNYDTGNTLFYNPTVKIEEDIKYGFEYLVHLHLKDIKIEGNHAAYTAIGDGSVNFPAVFDVLKTFGSPIPCGYEIPVHVRGVLGNIRPVDAPLTVESMHRAVETSTKYVASLLD